MTLKIIQILLVFCQVSQQDFHVRNALGTRKVVRSKFWLVSFLLLPCCTYLLVGLLRACEDTDKLDPQYLVLMLKAIKQLSMNANLLEVLQNANAIEILVKILDNQSTGPHSTVYIYPFPLYIIL